MSTHLIPRHLAQSLSLAQPCRDRELFTGDTVAAECGLELGHIERNQWHENAKGTRRWSLEKQRGEAQFGMKAPGTEHDTP